MNRTFLSLALLASATVAHADEAVVATLPPRVIGLDAIGVVPVGDYGQVATLGVGALLRAEVPAGPGFVTGRGGAIFHAMHDGVEAQLTLVPLYAGYRFPLGPSGAYLAGELGVTLAFASSNATFNGMTVSDSDSKLGLTLAAGLRRGVLDLRGGLFLPDVNHATGFMFSAGWDFASF